MRATAGVPRHAPRNPVKASGRIRAVDGLRAVGLAGVIAFHYGFGPSGGFLGLDLFFVVSGYVITRLLLIEWQRTGSIGRLRFWAQRARRLLPAVVVVLAGVQVAMRLGALPALRSTTDAQTVAALGYVSNWYAIVADVGYWGASADSTPLTHLWSLAVEEQFYLVWPLVLIVVLSLTRSRRVLAIVAGVGTVVSYAAGSVLCGLQGPERAYLGTDARCGALLLGVLLALLLTRHAPDADGSWNRRLPAPWAPVARPAYALALSVLALLWATSAIHGAWTYDGGMLLADLCGVVIVAHAVVVPGCRSTRLLASRPVVTVGRLSYSIYLWHWPVHIYALHRWAHLDKPVLIAVQLAATAVLGTASWALVERTTQRVGRPLVLAPPLLACGLLVLCSALFAHPAPPAERQDDVLVHGSP